MKRIQDNSSWVTLSETHVKKQCWACVCSSLITECFRFRLLTLTVCFETAPEDKTNQQAVKCPSSQPWNALLTQERKLRQVYFLHIDRIYNQYNQSQYWNSAGVVCLVPCTGTRCRQCKSQSSVVHETTLCYEENVTTHLKSALCCTEMPSLIEIPYDFREHFSSQSFW